MKLSSTSRKKTSRYKSLSQIIREAADIFRPPERLTVSAAAEEYVKLNNPGAYVGDWFNRTTPYMCEPMDTLAARDKKGCVFVGPAQSAKTQALILNWTAYGIKVDPMDMIIYNPSGAAARDFSTRRIDRLHRHSPAVGAMLLRGRDHDNKFDKHYTSGMILTLSWPSVTEFAGKPVGRIALTDYDRMDDDIEGDGSPFDLGMKRTTTFGSFAMTLAESSPSRPIKDPKWIARSPHEAPPCDGILGLYNRGDRRRWQWPCPNCGSYFEGRFEMLEWDSGLKNELDQADTVRMSCPSCDFKIHPDQRYDMQQLGCWIKEGEHIENGYIVGEGQRSDIASFWLRGVAASFVTWNALVATYISATKDFDRTGSEDSLKKFYNTDLGEPYLPKSQESERLPEVVKSRAEDWGSTLEEPTVPDGVRFLVAAVDVQKNAFVVQVHGILAGEPHDVVIVDRFNIHKSERLDGDGDRAWVKPATYLDDWDLIESQVMMRTYPLADGSGRRMMVKITGCDSGGREGVTANAYAYYRKLRSKGQSGRFQLVKGEPKVNVPRVRISHPDSNRRDTKAAAQGDVPVLMLNSTVLKDTLANRLEAVIPGKGMIRFPDWLPDWWYGEVCAEVRDEKGWTNPAHTRNEAWDLLYYCLGLCLSPMIKVEGIPWANPPAWAAEWEKNALILLPDQKDRYNAGTQEPIDFAKLASVLA